MRSSDDTERARHLSVAHRLAREMGVPEATVIEVYERELERLTGLARVKEYLAILVAKHVKIELATRKGEFLSPRLERPSMTRAIRTDIIEERDAALVE